MYQTCQLPIFHNANLPLPEMLHCISESVGLQINILLMCIKLVAGLHTITEVILHLNTGWIGIYSVPPVPATLAVPEPLRFSPLPLHVLS